MRDHHEHKKGSGDTCAPKGWVNYDSMMQTPSSGSKHMFLTTVPGNKVEYTKREVEGADEARILYRKLGHPSEEFFQHMLKNNLIRNCPVTLDDPQRAFNIYGPHITTLKGKTVKKQNSVIPNYKPDSIPAPIIAKHKNIRLFVDIFCMQNTFFPHHFRMDKVQDSDATQKLVE